MKKSDIIETVNARLDKLGVKPTSRSVKAVPSYVEIKVIAGGHGWEVRDEWDDYGSRGLNLEDAQRLAEVALTAIEQVPA